MSGIHEYEKVWRVAYCDNTWRFETLVVAEDVPEVVAIVRAKKGQGVTFESIEKEPHKVLVRLP